MSKKTAKKAQKQKPSFESLIQRKRDGGEFTEEDVRHIVDSVLDEIMPPEQQAALAMAIYFQGMSAQEIAWLSEEMMFSGEVVDLSKITKPKVGFHVMGGIGDSSAIVLAAISAAAGVVAPALLGTGEGYDIPAIEVLGGIKGYNNALTLKEFSAQLKKNLCAVSNQPEDIAPVDAMLYSLREQTATLPSIPLMAASILSRKLSAGAEAVVVDVKWGGGGYVKDLDQAKSLARTITRVARALNRRAVCLVTDGNQPLGETVGFNLQLQEIIELLQGEGPEELQELILKLGMEIMRLSGLAGSTLSAKQTVEKQLTGPALEVFKKMITAQGGDAAFVDDTSKLAKAKYTKTVTAPKRGYVHTLDGAMLAEGVRILATQKNGKFDPAVGLDEIQKMGTQVKQGETLLNVHYNSEKNLAEAMECFKNAYRLAPKRPNLPDLVAERVA